MSTGFWAIIGSNEIADHAGVEDAIMRVRSRLGVVSTPELVDFQNRLCACLYELDAPDLAAMPVELPGGGSSGQTDDHFLYARCACVLGGEEAYWIVLRDRSEFAAFVHVRQQSAELLMYAAPEEYERRTARPMPDGGQLPVDSMSNRKNWYDEPELVGAGTVSSWDRDAGWGVVTVDDGDIDVWVHFSNVDGPEGGYRELLPGHRVECVYELGLQDGYRARAVRVRGTSV